MKAKKVNPNSKEEREAKDLWQEFIASGMRPANIPANPDVVDKDKGWKGWVDWIKVIYNNNGFQSWCGWIGKTMISKFRKIAEG